MFPFPRQQDPQPLDQLIRIARDGKILFAEDLEAVDLIAGEAPTLDRQRAAMKHLLRLLRRRLRNRVRLLRGTTPPLV